MTGGAPAAMFAVGDELAGPVRVVTHERLLWYGEGMLAGASGERMRAHANIHTDEDYARSQGLPAAIADGMLSTNWISSLLLASFGAHYLQSGELRTKYIKPVFVGMSIRARARITAREDGDAGSVRFRLDVWAEAEGEKLTVGDAAVDVREREPHLDG